MYELAISAGAVVQFSSDVIDIDPSTPTVTLSTGEVLKPDVVIGADGYHSLCQKVIEGDVIADGGEPIEHISSGTVVYSMNADVSDVTLENDPELYGFIKKPVWTAFAGPHVSVLTWPSASFPLLRYILSSDDFGFREAIKSSAFKFSIRMSQTPMIRGMFVSP